VIIGGIVGATGIAWALHLKRLKDHVGMTRDEFVAQFQSTGVAAAIAAEVYDQFQKLGTWKGFMPSPFDTLEKTYKTVYEDVEENLREILQRLGFEMPHSGTLQEWDGPLETLRRTRVGSLGGSIAAGGWVVIVNHLGHVSVDIQHLRRGLLLLGPRPWIERGEGTLDVAIACSVLGPGEVVLDPTRP
jgi:hypothetical protein